MAKFFVEVYEVHTGLYEVEADDANEALRKYNTEGGMYVDNSGDFVSTDSTRGMSRDKALELGFDKDLIDEEWGIATIRSVEEDK